MMEANGQVCDHGLTMTGPCPYCYAILSQINLGEARYVNGIPEVRLSVAASIKFVEIANRPAPKRKKVRRP